MSNDQPPPLAGQQYETAYAMHYRTKDLQEALELYLGVMAAYPDTQEAQYSRSQIQNIANLVVPKQELLDAHMALARTYLEHELPPDVEPVSIASATSYR